MMDDSGAVLRLLANFMEEGEVQDLELALELLTSDRFYPSDILPAMQTFGGKPEYRARAMLAVRRHFGLPMIPGPVCRR